MPFDGILSPRHHGKNRMLLRVRVVTETDADGDVAGDYDSDWDMLIQL